MMARTRNPCRLAGGKESRSGEAAGCAPRLLLISAGAAMIVGFASAARAQLDVREMDGRAQVDTGAMTFTLDLRTGALTDLAVGGKQLVAGNTAAPLFATLMESEHYDGVDDFAPRKLLAARYAGRGLRVVSRKGTFVARGGGALLFPDGDALEADLEIETPADSTRLRIGVTLRPKGAFTRRYLREVGVRQPLSLAHRKRVVQAGDQGLRWDTRYNYQFHGHTKLFSYAEPNWWRHFFVDQETDHSYHIWRAESERTSGLTAFRGRRAAGWMTLYDQKGGALFAYRDLSTRPPKLLYAGGEDGGVGVVYLHGPTHPAFALSDPRLSASVFGKAHSIDWIFFAGEEAEVKPDALLAQHWGVDGLASDGPTRFTPVADEIDLWNAPPAPAAKVPLVMGGFPLPRGAVREPDQARLFVRGRESPLQARPLAYWPDHSIKWLLLLFPLDGDGGYGYATGSGEGRRAAFRVTLRKGDDVPCELRFGSGVSAGAPPRAAPLVAARAEQQVEIDTGPMRLTLATGERWMSSVRIDGIERLSPGGGAQAVVDFLRTEAYAPGTTHPEGVPEPGPVTIERIDVEENGPLRAVVLLRGKAVCPAAPQVVLRVETYRGRPFVRLTHSVVFMHNDIHKVFVRDMGLRFKLALDPAQLKAAAGGQGGTVALGSAPALGLRQASHVNYEAWRLAEGSPRRVVSDAGHASRGWLAVGDNRGGLAVIQRNMWQEGPKELRFRRDDAEFAVGLWPASGPLMDVRRYSEYVHPGQGEATYVGVPDPAKDRPWIESYYSERMCPFRGVSRTHEILLHFYAAGTPPAELDAVAADFQSQPLVYAGWPWYAEVGVTYPQVDPANAAFTRVNANLQNAADWWLFHQKAWGWYGLWDYGEVRHAFRYGSGWILAPERLAAYLALPAAQRAGFDPRPQRQDYFTQNDWAFDNGRWGWSNTEGLINHFMSRQYLRTGRRDLFFFAEANARHARDVVARHAGKFFGMGTRHGVQPWSDGNHEERQTIFAEQRFHYLLTGEPRTREWNEKLTRDYYLQGACQGSPDHSARSYGILFNWEITGDPEVGGTLERYMHALAQPEGIDTSPLVRFPAAEREAPGELHGPNARDGEMFFQSFGAMDAMLEYFYLTQDARVRDAIFKTAAHGLEAFRAAPHRGMMKIKPIACAARHAPDPAPFREALRTMKVARNIGYRYVYQQVPWNRDHWTGPTAFALGEMAYGWLNDASYALGALDAEPPLSAEQEAELRALDARPVQHEPRAPRESWQSEYDIPEFEPFIRDPWLR